MNRLLTSGCSFTKHCWNTWAEYLGNEYDWHKQLGIGGYDNANIARSVISTAKKNDTVVIMWTGYDRWNFYHNGWKHNGCLVGNKEFYVKYYSSVERFTTTMDYVQMVDSHSKLKGYKCYNFSAFNWILSEIQKSVPSELYNIYSSYDIDNNYLLDMNLLEFQENNNEVISVSHKYDKKDTHPTPLTHWKFLNTIIKPVIGLSSDNSVPSYVMSDQHDVINGNIT